MRLSYKYNTYCVGLRLLRCLKRRMRWVRAAGGVVVDDEGRHLLILRNGRWDLPKGKVEEGETLVEAALREVEEETGIAARVEPTAARHPVKTYHIYNLYGGWHLKQTTWYAMRVEGKQPPATPQTEEGIERCEWVAATEARRRLGKSYGTLRTVAKGLIGDEGGVRP